MKRILIIEDELEMLRNLTTILRLEKFCPLSAKNGHAGVDLAKKHKPDLILCDVMMPGLDGYGGIAALRADAETVTIPFIFLTAKAEKPDIRAGMNLGVDGYLIKPVGKLTCLQPSTRVSNALSSKQCLTSILPYRWRKRSVNHACAETLLWIAQGKTNGQIATILRNSDSRSKNMSLQSSKSSISKPKTQPACAL